MSPKDSEYIPSSVRKKNMMNVKWSQIGNYRPANLKEYTTIDNAYMALRHLMDLIFFFISSVFLICFSIIQKFFRPKNKDIKGCVALVTGGANGLGKAIAQNLVAKGAKVAIADLDAEAGRLTADELCAESGSKSVAIPYVIDVSNPEEIDKLRDQIKKDFGEPATIIVNNAAVIPTINISDATTEDVRRIVEININSHIWVLRAFLPDMKKLNKGHIVTISSLSGLLGLSRASIYAMTKAAVACLSTSVYDEVRDDGYDGIKFSIAYPYFIATRQDIYDIVQLRVPPVTPKFAADTIVNGMLKDTLHIGVPPLSMYLGPFIRMCPESVVQLARKTFSIDIPSSEK